MIFDDKNENIKNVKLCCEKYKKNLYFKYLFLMIRMKHEKCVVIHLNFKIDYTVSNAIS